MIDHEDFSVVVKQRPAAKVMAVGDLSCWTSQRDRPFRGLFRLHNSSQSSGKSGAQAYVERVSRLTREAELLAPVHVRPLNCENRAPVAGGLGHRAHSPI
jgi:hypothetical protein